MSSNILIALATGLASATAILLVLRTVLKISTPNAFNEKIPSHPTTGSRVVTEMSPTSAQALISDTATLAALSGLQVVRILSQSSTLIVADAAVQEIGKQKQNALSPPGQTRSPNPGATNPTKSNTGAAYETLCGSAR